MDELDLINLKPLMSLTEGNQSVKVGLIDGPIDTTHPSFSNIHIQQVTKKFEANCTIKNTTACMHGTFVAGILSSKRGSQAPAICPGCTLLVRPAFLEQSTQSGELPKTTLGELSNALVECINAGASIINISAAPIEPSLIEDSSIKQALDNAARRGVLVIAAAGNHGLIGSTAITRHPWVIPVVACDLSGRPFSRTNLGSSIGQRGLTACGDSIKSVGAGDKPIVLTGTSAAAPFVTGAAALLLSIFPDSSAQQLKVALTQSNVRRTTIVPPLLNAKLAHEVLKAAAKKAS